MNRRRKLAGIFIIVLYGLFLTLMRLWWFQYYMTPLAGDWGFLFYLPYACGGAFLLCVLVGVLVMKASRCSRIWEAFLYLLLLLLAVYFPHGFREAQISGFYDRQIDWSVWLKPLICSNPDARIIMLESGVGFVLGSLPRFIREKRKILT